MQALREHAALDKMRGSSLRPPVRKCGDLAGLKMLFFGTRRYPYILPACSFFDLRLTRMR